jgi:hypothetical protein
MLLIFFPAPYRSILKQSLPRRQRILWISKRWLPSKTVARLGSTARLVPFLLPFFDQLSPKSSEKIFLHISIMLLIPGGSPPVALFHPGLCDMDYPATSPTGSRSVWYASGTRSSATHAWPPQPFPIPLRCFSHLHVDLVGPLQYSDNFN